MRVRRESNEGKGEKMATFGSANIRMRFNEQWTQHACKYLDWNWVCIFCLFHALSLTRFLFSLNMKVMNIHTIFSNVLAFALDSSLDITMHAFAYAFSSSSFRYPTQTASMVNVGTTVFLSQTMKALFGFIESGQPYLEDGLRKQVFIQLSEIDQSRWILFSNIAILRNLAQARSSLEIMHINPKSNKIRFNKIHQY